MSLGNPVNDINDVTDSQDLLARMLYSELCNYSSVPKEEATALAYVASRIYSERVKG